MADARFFAAATMAALSLPLVVRLVRIGRPRSGGTALRRPCRLGEVGDLSSLRVYPTVSGRVAAAQLGTNAQADEAWGEVLTLSPDADIPGMKAQFLCHWHYAEFAQPGKTSWNLEPWRPEVGDDAMAAAGCNPGGTEEPF